MAPHIKDFVKTDKGYDKYVNILSKGYETALVCIYYYFIDILHKENLLSHDSIAQKINECEKTSSDLSNLFITYREYATSHLDELPDQLIIFMALEAIVRYSTTLISNLYPGQNEIKTYWKSYITNYYFEIWQNSFNLSAYRNINQDLYLLNQKEQTKFIPVDTLGLDDDALDSYMTHILAFGWLDSTDTLSSILAITCDPFEAVCDRVKQYQTYLAYSQNNPQKMVKISHEIKPGSLYYLDRYDKIDQCTTFYPATVSYVDDKVQITHSHEPTLEITKKDAKLANS